jgi:Tfp pilus assembly protein PilF
LKLDQTGAGSTSTSGEVRPSAAQARTGVKPSFDKDATLPSERQIRSSLKDYFDSSQSLEAAGLDITDTGERLRRGTGVEAGDRTTRVAADAVFAASRRSAYTPFYIWLIGVAAVLLLLMAVGLYFEMSTPDRVTPVIAERPKAPAAQPPVSTPATTAAKTEAATVAPVPTPAPAAPTSAPKAETPPQVTAEPAKLAGDPNDAIVPPTTITETAAPAIEPEIPKDLTSTGLGSPVRARERPRYPVAQSPVKITRSFVRDSAIDDINEAYRAFQGGNDARAERLYRSVLDRYPDRRDALLGLAAIAMRQGNKDRAYQAYRRVLQLNPQDPVASAALFSLHSGPDSEMNESKLKLLLDQKSKSPQVLFSLGNYYAKQSRWAEAQQAYFDAYASDSRNPDYAFNLAVSLERIGQSKTALTYYRKALEHADQRPGGFNTAQALARIGALSATR